MDRILDYTVQRSNSLAIAGATIDNTLATWGFGDMNPVAEFQLFYASRPESASRWPEKTMALFWVGINEYVSSSVFFRLPCNVFML